MLTYTTVADVMRPVLVDRRRGACSSFDEGGRCVAPAISIDDETPELVTPASWGPNVVIRRERRTALGWVIIAASLGSALVAGLFGWVLDATSSSCEPSTCGTPHDVGVGLEVGAVITAIAGTISGIAVAGTSHDVRRRTTMLVPSIEVRPGGGAIGLRLAF